jgi:hypothetical protein
MSRLRRAVAAAAMLPIIACRPSAGASVPSEPGAVVRAHLEAENAHDVVRILATLADSVEMHVFGTSGRDSTFVLNHDALRQTYERAVSAAPQSHLTALSQIVSGPLVVSREQASGLPGGAREVGLAMYRVAQGRIVALWILNTEGLNAGS